MGVGEGSAPWVEVAEGVLENSDQSSSGRERDGQPSGVALDTPADWALLFVLTAIMAVPFGLVAWLMS